MDDDDDVYGKPKLVNLKKRSRNQLDNGKRKRHNAYPNDHSSWTPPKVIGTLYRILCPVKKIGSVLGKGGEIVNALRDETRAKITVADAIPGAEERVIIIFNYPSKQSGKDDNDRDPENDNFAENEFDDMRPHCPAQDALLRVHDRIAADEYLRGGVVHEKTDSDDTVTARILVPSNQVGCLLGKGGTVIQKLQYCLLFLGYAILEAFLFARQQTDQKTFTDLCGKHDFWPLEFMGRPIRMMGAFDSEVKEVSQTSMKSDLRIIGFEEEGKRSIRRSLNSLQASLKLPQGAYVFCDFRTLHLPGIELNPPPSEALRRMHMLACDPGIIAIMSKHRWRVGIMTEMAPVGYVGISPKCILGFNKNQGEEISLHLRTDDLKGFRKYESIKKTLLHELAHMVYSEHDATFYALDKQLNEEAASLDWTKSRSHTLSGRKISNHHEEEVHFDVTTSNTGQKLGGASDSLASARASSVAAAYSRFLNSFSEEPSAPNKNESSYTAIEPDSDDGELKGDPKKIIADPDPDDALMIECYAKTPLESIDGKEPGPDDSLDKGNTMIFEPDPGDSLDKEYTKMFEPDPDDSLDKDNTKIFKPDPDDSLDKGSKMLFEPGSTDFMISIKKCDPNNLTVVEAPKIAESDANDLGIHMVDTNDRNVLEPDPDDSTSAQMMIREKFVELDPDSSGVVSGTNNSVEYGVGKYEPDPDDDMDCLKRIEDSAAIICSRIQRSIEILRSDATPVEASSVLQTLVTIIRNVIEHPEEMKFRRLRKSNSQIQRNVVRYRGAMEFLSMIGFYEDVITDEVGRSEAYLVLKRNDPGLLWLAKSSLEVSMA